MYSGSTITSFSGRLIGAHQKIDRLARNNLELILPASRFPQTAAILHFEGQNGPDAIKRKSPAQDEPWHYLQPFDNDDRQLLDLISHHHKSLIRALKKRDDVRASFEAAWLAHAVVDGLTPAHHYPYEEKLVELRGGLDRTDRTTISKKLIMPGQSRRHQAGNNWRMWGPKGLFTTHAAFEWGVAMILAPLRTRKFEISPDRLATFNSQPLDQWFRLLAQEVARLELYDNFYQTGWTVSLARRTRRYLIPILVQAVALVWYGAAQEAGLQTRTL